MDQSEVCAVILDRVNTVRTHLGHGPLTELPVGTRKDPGGCVIANALKDAIPGIYVGSTEIGFGDEVDERFRVIIQHSFYGDGSEIDPPTKTFINWFDEGRLPALVDPRRPELVDVSA